MKKLVLTLSLITGAIWSQAQIVVNGVSPSSIQGSYEFTYTSNPTNTNIWGGDMTVAAVQAPLMIVDDGTAADSLGCGTLVNDLTGKIAVIYRGSCSFYSKCLNAQTAGALAVIVINNTGGLITMSSTITPSLVTIPAVCISQEDGAAIRAVMDQEEVTMFIGNLTGFYTDNVGMYNDYAGRARSYATPALTAAAQAEFSLPLTAYLFNRGSLDATNAMISVDVSFNGSSIHTDASTPTTIPAGDTINVQLADFSQASYPVGKYTVTYTATMDNTDLNPSDNVMVQEFEITDGMYSLAPLDVNGLPIATTHTRSGTTGLTAFTPCIKYENSHANRIDVQGMYFSAKLDTVSLDQEEFNLVAYQWDDVFDPAATTYADNFTQLTEIANVIYNISGDPQGVMQYVPFSAPVLLDNDTKYLFCVTPTTNPNINIGFNNVIDYGLNNFNFSESVHPMQVTAASVSWYSGFTSNLVPAIGLLTADVNSIGIFENSEIEGSVYPNPANDAVVVSINATGNAKLIVTDITGKVVMNNEISLANGKSNVNIASLNSGMYIFNIVLENGTSSQVSVVKK